MIKLKQLVQSFVYAKRGLVRVFRTEQNFRVQILISLVVVIIGAVFRLTSKEWVVVLLVICLVLLLELVNTVVEKVIDILKPKIHSYVAIIKDVMAAAVLLAAVFATIIGLIIFYPYVVALIGGN